MAVHPRVGDQGLPALGQDSQARCTPPEPMPSHELPLARTLRDRSAGGAWLRSVRATPLQPPEPPDLAPGNLSAQPDSAHDPEPPAICSMTGPGDRFIVPVTFNGKSARALVDTGAQRSVVLQHWVKRVTRDKNHRLRFKSAAAPVSVRGVTEGTVTMREICCGVITFTKQARSYADLLVFPGRLPGVDIILGTDWLKPRNVSVHCGHGVMCLPAPGGRQHCIKAIRPKAAAAADPPPDAHLAPMLQQTRSLPPLSPGRAARLLRQGCDAYLFLLMPVKDDTTDLVLAALDVHTGRVDVKGLVPESEMQSLLAEAQRLGVFTEPAQPKPSSTVHPVTLEPGHKPPYQRPYRLSPAELAEARKQIQEYLQKGLIEPAASPYGAPILFVQKKTKNPDGTPELRMCVDYRALNKITIKDKFPLPRIEDLLDRIRGSTVFSTMDLCGGFHQAAIPPEDRHKTAFVTSFGQYQFKVLCFGLSNAPSTFQRMMDSVFADMIAEGWLVIYIDDLLVHSKTPAEHVQQLRRVFQRLHEHGLYLKLKKCVWNRPQVKFLGHLAGRDGVSPDPDKVATVRDWPVPTCLKDLQGFLGLANYFRKFIKGYSTIAGPLTTLCGTEASEAYDWHHWGKTELTALQALKDALTSAPVLAVPDPDKPYVVRTDASLLGTGGVLMQGDRVIAYCSKKFSKAEVNYTTTDQEMLGVIHALQEWRCHLEGAQHQVLVVTDHQPLTYFFDKTTLSRRQARWKEFLSRFNLKFQYEAGKNNVADPVSRNPALAGPPADDSDESDSDDVLAPVAGVQWMLLLSRQQARAAGLPVAGTRRSARILEQREASTSAAPGSPLPDGEEEAHPPPSKRRRRDSGPKQPAAGRISEAPPDEVEPPAPPVGHELLQALQAGYKHDDRFKSPRFTQFLEHREGLWFSENRVIVPNYKPAKHLILHECHNVPMAGHPGVARTLHRVTRNFYWPSVRADVEEHVRSCDSCQRNKHSTQRKAGELQPLSVPERRWADLSMDLIVKLPETVTGFDSILVVVCRLSKMTHLIPCCESMSAKSFAKLFVSNIVRLHGLPTSITSDRGTHWNNEFWAHVCALLGITRKLSSAYHPQTNGQVERMNQVIEATLRAYIAPDQRDWDEHLPMVEFSINDSWQDSIRNTPFFLNHGQHPLTPVQLMMGAPDRVPHAQSFVEVNIEKALTRAKECIRAAQQRMVSRADEKRRAVEYREGDLVLLSTANLSKKKAGGGTKKLRPRWLGPFPVIRMVGRVSAELQLPPTWTRVHNVFHVSLLKHYRTPTGTSAAESELVQPPPPVQWLDGEPLYTVERLLDHKVVKKGRKSQLQYKVRWEGYSEEHDTWEPRENLLTCSRLIREYKRQHGIPLSASDDEEGSSSAEDE